LYFYISTFRSICAVPNMAVFWSSLTSCFPGMLLTYFLNDFENDFDTYYYYYYYANHMLYTCFSSSLKMVKIDRNMENCG